MIAGWVNKPTTMSPANYVAPSFQQPRTQSTRQVNAKPYKGHFVLAFSSVFDFDGWTTRRPACVEISHFRGCLAFFCPSSLDGRVRARFASERTATTLTWYTVCTFARAPLSRRASLPGTGKEHSSSCFITGGATLMKSDTRGYSPFCSHPVAY